MVRLRRLMKTEGAEDFLAATGMSWMKRQASHKPDILIWCLLLTSVEASWSHSHVLVKRHSDILLLVSVVVLASLVPHSGPRKKTPRLLSTS